MIPSPLKLKQNWIPLVFFLFGLLFVLLLGTAHTRKHNQQNLLATNITAEQVRIRLESCFDSRGRLVQTLANHPWQSRGQLVDDWTSRAGPLLQVESGVQALNYVDPEGIIRVVYPAEPNRAALGANLRNNINASVVRALRLAEVSGQMTRTDIVELLQSGKGFALYKEIRNEAGEALGFVNGVFRVQDLMANCLEEGSLRDSFKLTLLENGDVFYDQGSDPESDAGRYQVSLPIDVPGSGWQLNFTPSEPDLFTTDSRVDELWIALGLLLTTLLTVAIRIVLIKQSDLEHSEDIYRLLVENQTDMVVKINPAGEFQYVSPSYCKTFGKKEKDLLGKAFMPVVHEDDREFTNRSLESLKEPPNTSYHEQRAMTKDGWRWLAWSNKALFDDDGNIEAITAVGRDVTDVKMLEQRMAHSQKMKAMGELAGGITHDFNNLLQIILGNIELTLMTPDDAGKTKKSLKQIRKVVERAINLTTKLSTLSRQETTRPEVFDLNEYIEELSGLLVHALPASVDLVFDHGHEAMPVRADRTQIEQVLLNLCFNARDAIEPNGRITIRTRRKTLDKKALSTNPELKPGDYVNVTVEDNGRGIDPENLSRIFDPFFTTKEAGTGTGLGLANCYSIIERHEGMILVDSRPGEGSCFSVYLPMAHWAVEAGEKEQPRIVRQNRSEGKTVLVAEDNPQLLKLTRRMLKTAGFDTIGVSNGRQALDAFETHDDDICLMVLDLVMPEMGGAEVAEHIRQKSDDVKILIVSGFVPDEQAASLRDPVIRKPFTIETLIDAVNEALIP